MNAAPIDVIVPVYNATQDLRRCVASVRAHTARAYRLILIDDASPDSTVAAYFDELRQENVSNLLLLRNEKNLGFVGTINIGMALSQHDAVLLNSDAIVTSRWLEKLARCAQSDPRIGTITPFSNNAEICSLPKFCENNLWPDEADPEVLNRALELAAVPSYPDLPTGVGFCFYIRRRAWERFGPFDPAYGLGYGEENDFCMRVAAGGYRNVLCDDTLVLHMGNKSFDAKKKSLSQNNMQLLLQRHPGYGKLVHDFIAADPIRPLRELALSHYYRLLAGASCPGILHILHGRGGGTERHIRELIRASHGGFRHYLLLTLGDTWELEDHNGETVIRYQLQHLQDELWHDLLGGLCAAFGIALCHVHHLSGCRSGLLAAFKDLRIPYGFTLHDFYLACPTITLLNEQQRYCGAETDGATCRRCLAAQPFFGDIDIERWRNEHGDFLAQAQFVIAPSRSAFETLQRYFPLHDVRVIPHGLHKSSRAAAAGMRSVLLLPNDGIPTVGVLGAIGPVKGARRLERLVARTRERKLKLRWVLIGYLDRQYQAYQDIDQVFTIHGPYREEDLQDLIAHYRTRLMVFPSAGPETFSFTLSESWHAGCPALVPPIGALAERVRAAQAGWVIENWEDDDHVLDELVALLAPENAEALAQASARARALVQQTPIQMTEATDAVYRSVRAPTPTHRVTLPKRRLLDALEAAHGTAAAEERRKNRWTDRALLALAKLGLRFRYTWAGRWAYHLFPQRWQRTLKRRLLT